MTGSSERALTTDEVAYIAAARDCQGAWALTAEALGRFAPSRPGISHEGP